MCFHVRLQYIFMESVMPSNLLTSEEMDLL